MNSETAPIGHELKIARETLALTINDVMAILKIKPQVVEMIEGDHYPNQTLDVFTKGHIVAYSKLLKVNPQTIINKLEAKGYDFPAPKQANEAEEKPKSLSFPKKPLIIGGLAIYAFISLVSYQKPKQERSITPPVLQGTYYQ